MPSSRSGKRHAILRRIEQLDPQQDASAITSLFYADFRAVMVLQSVTGNLMTFAVPRMSRILAATGEFTERTDKRVLDTALLTGAVIQHGLGPGTGRAAARRVNAMHRRYDIHPDDFVAVGCDIALASLHIAERFGRRKVTDREREALRIHTNLQARAFGSHRPLPPTLPEMQQLWDRYLDEQAFYEPQNRELADAFLGFLATRMPDRLRGVAVPMLLAQVDPRILRACGLAVPARATRIVSTALFRLLGAVGPYLPSDGSSPLEVIAEKVYPHGWTVETLGTHLPACPAGGADPRA